MLGGARSWLAYKRAVLQFVVLLALCMVGFNVLFILWLTPSEFFQTYLRLNATASATVLQVLGDDADVSGTSIVSPRFSMGIVRGCEAIQVSAFYIFAVVLWPLSVSWGRRAMGMAVGALLLLTLNLVRIVSLYYIGIYFPSAFEAVHIDVWQPAFIVLALLFWVIWVRWVTRAEVVKPDVAV
jgi:exosortase/archaeosortase family protein